MDDRGTGLAVLRVFQHARTVPAGRLTSTYVRPAFLAGQAMSFAERLRSRGRGATPGEIETLASMEGLSPYDLVTGTLPALKACGVIDYRVDGSGSIGSVEEYVGVSAPFLVQVSRVFSHFRPRPADLALVASAHLAAFTPLTERNHLDAVAKEVGSEEAAVEGLRAARTVELVRSASSVELRENIVYNEYVWATGAVEAAGFMRQLPPNEREVLLGIFEAASRAPGLALPKLALTTTPEVLAGARKVGLVDSVGVVSRTGTRQTYLFSPLLERHLAIRETTDGLHERKLFVAHILFGHQFGNSSTGRIDKPVVLVDRLLRRGEVGPATAISTDYLLPESFGIVRTVPVGGGRSMLQMVKRDVIEDSLELLRVSLGTPVGGPPGAIDGLWLPGSFESPEQQRRAIRDPDGYASELFDGVIRKLHDEAAKVTRDEELF